MSIRANGGRRPTNNPIARRDRFISEQLTGLSRDALVVNVGCGTVRRFEGSTARYLATDLRPLASVDFVADVTALPLADGSVDAIVALELIEHVPDPTAALCELARAVRPGGRVIVSVPSAVPRHDHHDYWRFTAEGLQRLGSETLGPGEVHVFGGTFEALGTLIEYYLALVLHVLRLPGERMGRIFSSLGYRLDRRNRWSTSTTELHTLAFDLLYVTAGARRGTPENTGNGAAPGHGSTDATTA